MEDRRGEDRVGAAIGDATHEVVERADPAGRDDGDGWRRDLQIVSSGLRSTIEYGVIYKGQEFSSHAPLVMDYDIESEQL